MPHGDLIEDAAVLAGVLSGTASGRAQIAADQSASALDLSNRMVFDDVIDPRDLRNALLDGLMLADNRLPKG